MSPEQVKAFHAHVWPLFWPLLWWNWRVYAAWRAQMRAAGYGAIFIAVSRWGQIVVTWIEPPDAPAADWTRLSQTCRRALAARLGETPPPWSEVAGAAAPGLWARLTARFGARLCGGRALSRGPAGACVPASPGGLRVPGFALAFHDSS